METRKDVSEPTIDHVGVIELNNRAVAINLTVIVD